MLAGLIVLKNKIPTHKIPSRQKSDVIYTRKSLGCGEDYAGKTDRCVITILNERSNCSNEPMFQQLQHYEKVLKTITLYQLPNTDTDVSADSLQAHIASVVSDNRKILDSNTSWVQFCFLAVTLH